MNTQLPRMNINSWKAVLNLPVDDTFEKRTFDRASLRMTVHKNDGSLRHFGEKIFCIHSTFQVYGWTDSTEDAFQAWDNIEIYKTNEIYEAFRGR